MIPLLLARGAWRYLAGGAIMVAAAAWLAAAGYRHGVAAERARWLVRAAAVDAARARADAARAAHAVAADRAAAARDDHYAQVRAPLTQKVIRYVATPAAAAACPDLHGVQLGQAAIDAANAATAAPR